MSEPPIVVGSIALALLLGTARAAAHGGAVSRTSYLAPMETARDTPPPAASEQPRQPNQQRAGEGTAVSQVEYEGWRQYSVYCARCHGQDALPNPVAANLLVSLGPGGPIDSPEKFGEVVVAGRPAKGMPSFKGVLSPGQIQAINDYLTGRAGKRIPPGRPAAPNG